MKKIVIVIFTVCMLSGNSLAQIDTYLNGDFDGDTYLDTVEIVQANLDWYVYRGGSHLRPVWLHGWGNANMANAKGDFDGNGKDDILLIMQNPFQWHLAMSTGSNFAPHANALIGKGAGDNIVVGDFDGDTHDDVVLMSSIAGKWFFMRLNTSTFKFMEFPTNNVSVFKGQTCSVRDTALGRDKVVLETYTGTTYAGTSCGVLNPATKTFTITQCNDVCPRTFTYRPYTYGATNIQGPWVSKTIDRDMMINGISGDMSFFYDHNSSPIVPALPISADMCLFIAYPPGTDSSDPSFGYPYMTGGFSEIICNHNSRKENRLPWRWDTKESGPNILIPKGSQIYCSGTFFDDEFKDFTPNKEFGMVSCNVSLEEFDPNDPGDVAKAVRVLRFPYHDQRLPFFGGKEVYSPWISYVSTNSSSPYSYPIKVTGAAFFLNVPPCLSDCDFSTLNIDFCLYKIEKAPTPQGFNVLASKCIRDISTHDYIQYQSSRNFEGYIDDSSFSNLLMLSPQEQLSWELQSGQEIVAQCYYGSNTNTNKEVDCAAYVFSKLEYGNSISTRAQVFTNIGYEDRDGYIQRLVDQWQAANYCTVYKDYFTHPTLSSDASSYYTHGEAGLCISRYESCLKYLDNYDFYDIITHYPTSVSCQN